MISNLYMLSGYSSTPRQACEKLRIIPAQNHKSPKMDILEITVDKLQQAIISE
jgi:hypothetical protein